jgi:hypothetical protein
VKKKLKNAKKNLKKCKIKVSSLECLLHITNFDLETLSKVIETVCRGYRHPGSLCTRNKYQVIYLTLNKSNTINLVKLFGATRVARISGRSGRYRI